MSFYEDQNKIAINAELSQTNFWTVGREKWDLVFCMVPEYLFLASYCIIYPGCIFPFLQMKILYWLWLKVSAVQSPTSDISPCGYLRKCTRKVPVSTQYSVLFWLLTIDIFRSLWAWRWKVEGGYFILIMVLYDIILSNSFLNIFVQEQIAVLATSSII